MGKDKSAANLNTKKRYSAEDIEVLEGLEPVRERPGMYIAGTDTPQGLHQLVSEIVDNSVDEAMNGHADQITVTLHKDSSSVTVTDNGRGIPVDQHKKFKKSALELILTTLHAGGKFGDQNYKTAGGLHGVGSSVVNALSVELIARVRREGGEYEQTFSRGKPTSKLKKLRDFRGSGTTIFFRPDPDIFSSIKFSSDIIRQLLKGKAYLNPGLMITFLDEKSDTKEEFKFPDGIRSHLAELLAEDQQEPLQAETFYLERDDKAQVQIALAWTEATAERFFSYVNGIHTPDGGTHEQGAKNGIVKAVKNYCQTHEVLPKGVKLIAEDIREGVFCVVSVKLPGGAFKTQFQGQTKSKLNNPEVTPLVENVTRGLEKLLNEKPSAAQAIVERIILAAKAREASRSAVQAVTRKLAGGSRLTLPGKLSDCSSGRADETELFIVEGDSAGGSAKQGRDRNFQAVLALRGKVLNTISANTKQILENKEFQNIISALGCGFGEHLKLDKLRYGKVIILTDADADGMHISTLLLAFFFTHLRGLIDRGAIYLGKPPLYGVFPKGSGEKKPFFAFSDKELESQIGKKGLSTAHITRYKGLGEMNPDTLWDTTLNPKTRTLLKVKADDQIKVTKKLQDLMGNDSKYRFELIQSRAHEIEIDV
ncbi:type IIA DNA topoisomerase subunit B [bacterium]|nr:type IIA DNA topoisomerase subunit B [bacterium]